MTAMRQTWPTSFKNITNIGATEVCLKVYQSQMNKDKCGAENSGQQIKWSRNTNFVKEEEKQVLISYK